MNPSELSDRELDAAVAREVLGWVPDHDGGPVWLRYVEGVGAADTAWIGDFWPSTDPRAMMEVVRAMRSLGFSGLIEWLADEGSEIADVVVSINHDDFEWPEMVEGSKIERTYAEAALLAVRAKKGEGDEK